MRPLQLWIGLCTFQCTIEGLKKISGHCPISPSFIMGKCPKFHREFIQLYASFLNVSSNALYCLNEFMDLVSISLQTSVRSLLVTNLQCWNPVMQKLNARKHGEKISICMVSMTVLEYHLCIQILIFYCQQEFR